MKKTHTNLSIGILILFFFAAVTFAHSIVLWAYFENGEVYVEAFTQKGTKIKAAQLVVVDKAGKTLLEGTTDDQGKFQFVPPIKDEMTIVMIADEAHQADFTLMPEDFAD
jgi:uncharacterized GH25 family protein